MPRKARRREKKLPHHIMSRSIPELDLFNTDGDKDYYLKLMKTASTIYQVEILAYCLMDNHVHLLIHPRGADIAKFMRKINSPYARYYNKTFKRRGHLFGERYKNIVIEEERQLLRTSTYIHDNAKDILYKGYRSIEEYPYSSIRDYISPKSGRGIANPNVIFSLMGGNKKNVMKHYALLLEHQSKGREAFEIDMEEAFKQGRYVNESVSCKRNVDPHKVITVLEKLIGVNEVDVRHIKYSRKDRTFKFLLAISLRIFSGMSLKEMTNEFKGHTASVLGIYAREGLKIFEKDKDIANRIRSSL